jgi:biopolymer transport protein TolR
MVTAPMLTQGVDVNLPQASAKALRSEEERLVITVDAYSRIFVGKQPVEFNRPVGYFGLFALQDHLEKLLAAELTWERRTASSRGFARV